MTEKTFRYRFVPRLPTKDAWEERPFKEYICKDAMFSALKAKEKELGPFNYLDGYIYYKDGCHSTYKDGTEPRPYRNYRWWKTGEKSCWRKCCTVLPEGETYDNSEPSIIEPHIHKKNYQEFRRIRGCGGAEEQFNEIKDISQISSIWLNKLGWFFVEEIL